MSSAIALLAIAVGAAGCASSTSGSHAAVTVSTAGAPVRTYIPRGPDKQGRPDPCTLIDSKAVVAAGGKPNVQGLVHNDYGPGCDYGAVELYYYDTQAQFQYGSGLVPVRGVGDKAYHDPEWHALRVQQGTIRFEVRCLLCPENKEVQELTFLAHDALGNLR